MPGSELDDEILDFKLLLYMGKTQEEFGGGEHIFVCGRNVNHWGPVVNYVTSVP